jgi:serine/threonine-protein kinase
MTMRGMILGTAAYMSPEQAKGLSVDRRADVWAFGAVLFEMLSGERAFPGDDVGETLASVIKGTVEWTALPATTPASVRRLLRRCLTKDVSRRLQHIGDARLELDDSDPDAAHASGTAPAPAGKWRSWLAAATTGALIAGGTVWSLVPKAAPLAVRRFTIPGPGSPSASFPQLALGGDIVLSPDGQTLLYHHPTAGLLKRQANGADFEPLRGAERGAAPFFSPDGAWIGFREDAKLKKVPFAGGLAMAICDAPEPMQGTWGDDGTIVASTSANLYRVPSSGGVLELILEADAGGPIGQPYFLPGSRAVLVRRGNAGDFRIEAIDLATRQTHPLAEGTTPQVSPTGDLVFELRGRLLAAAFDADRLALAGAPVPVVEGVTSMLGAALFSVARDGSLVYVSGKIGSGRTLTWIDRTGRATTALETRAGFQSPRLSPDGKAVVVSVIDQAGLGLWRYEFERGSRLRLTTTGESRRTAWAPDGVRIAFYSAPQRGGEQELYVMPSTGGDARLLLERPGLQYPDAWSPDGRFLVFEDAEGQGAMIAGRRDLWLLPIGEAPRPLLVTRFNERGAAFSPDGRWLAFVTDESGRDEVYVQPFPGPGAKLPISTSGGLQPMWSRDGQELYYREGDALMAVPVQLTPLRAGAARRLFDLPAATYGLDMNFADYDVAPDGRFLAASFAAASTTLHFVQNWTEELRRALGR